jgi:hypothetical protein
MVITVSADFEREPGLLVPPRHPIFQSVCGADHRYSEHMLPLLGE